MKKSIKFTLKETQNKQVRIIKLIQNKAKIPIIETPTTWNSKQKKTSKSFLLVHNLHFDLDPKNSPTVRRNLRQRRPRINQRQKVSS